MNPYLSNAEISYIDNLYQTYQTNPDGVDTSWRRFFEGFDFARENGGEGASPAPESALREIKVLNLINAYRSRGHLFAQTNPILPNKAFEPTLAIENFGLTTADLDQVFQVGAEIGQGPAPLRDIIARLEATYCRSIGAEYRYVRRPDRVQWLETRMEATKNQPAFTVEEKKHILRKIGQATKFEEFLGKKYVGQKRFSLEGGESIIPALDALIEHGAALGVEEFTMGMAHRGRLNVLANAMRKEYDEIFGHFAGKGVSDHVFDGDVKYHLGHTSKPILSNGKQVRLSLSPNPSHLEAVNPIVAGKTRALMETEYDGDSGKICPVIIHGDASLSGQGVVYELIQASQLKGYATGGTVHIVINNQVGFTTDPEDSRSSTYCTDLAKVTLSPVFHVNGEDIEAVVYVTKLAMEFRQVFKRDVFIDIICYRKYGHNEGDEPRFTQPLMYEAIAKRPTPYQVYVDKLLKEGQISEEDIKAVEKELNDYLNKEWGEYQVNEYKLLDAPKDRWQGVAFYDDVNVEPNQPTGVEEATLKFIAERITDIPDGFNLHRNVAKLVADRKAMVFERDKIDWGMGEHLAFGSILMEGRRIRLSGQDAERGTFSHRHAVVHDMTNDARYTPLQNLQEEQGVFNVYNSLLSEYAVLGFDLGYAAALPHALTIWEAQYGDFANGAQIIIDQFLSSAKAKWQRLSGITLLLPHGYEGGGPEHSSARPERFLILCAQNNMYVCNITTPANFFHALRRQVHNVSRRPLVVFSPKSLLRLPECTSSLRDFTQGTFQEVIDDVKADPLKVTRVVFTSGKLYYDLAAQRDKLDKTDVAIVRLEQMYPFPQAQLDAIVQKYSLAASYVWAQEEPENMGPWSFILRKFRSVSLELVSRKEAASPATATMAQHLSQQEYIIKKSLMVHSLETVGKA